MSLIWLIIAAPWRRVASCYPDPHSYIWILWRINPSLVKTELFRTSFLLVVFHSLLRGWDMHQHFLGDSYKFTFHRYCSVAVKWCMAQHACVMQISSPADSKPWIWVRHTARKTERDRDQGGRCHECLWTAKKSQSILIHSAPALSRKEREKWAEMSLPTQKDQELSVRWVALRMPKTFMRWQVPWNAVNGASNVDW